MKVWTVYVIIYVYAVDKLLSEHLVIQDIRFLLIYDPYNLYTYSWIYMLIHTVYIH
jgi:hypothetical protein